MRKKMVVKTLNTRSRGFTLVEIAMVLAIAALLIAGVMLFFNNASQARQTNDALQEVAAIQQTVRSLYSGQPDYGTLSTADVSNSKQLPNKWAPTNPGGTLVNPFGSAVTVLAATTPNQFTTQFSGIPDASCSKMVTMDMGTGMASLVVNGGSPTVGKAMDPTTANTNCNAGNNPGNTIAWTFY